LTTTIAKCPVIIFKVDVLTFNVDMVDWLNVSIF
jgi:hypothetical protein